MVRRVVLDRVCLRGKGEGEEGGGEGRGEEGETVWRIDGSAFRGEDRRERVGGGKGGEDGVADGW